MKDYYCIYSNITGRFLGWGGWVCSPYRAIYAERDRTLEIMDNLGKAPDCTDSGLEICNQKEAEIRGVLGA